MSKKQQDPAIDFGFHAVIPRALRTEYKSGETKLTPVQKWLYVCLKDLCGDHGTCYRALRTLAEETDISTGMLSESIQDLHRVGLIHAEKKKRSTGGKDVWHITIVDIWQKNAKLHPTKRSHSEQKRSPDEQSLGNVHDVDEVSNECSPDEQKRSHSELECSHSETEAITGSNTNKVSLSPSLNAQDDAVEVSHKVELTPEQKTRARSLKAKIEDRCGKLASGGANINENKAIARLVSGYSDADIDDVLHYLLHCHFKWSKPDFKFKIRGNVLLDEIEGVLRLFQENASLRNATSPPKTERTPEPTVSRYRKLEVPPMAVAAGGAR